MRRPAAATVLLSSIAKAHAAKVNFNMSLAKLRTGALMNACIAIKSCGDCSRLFCGWVSTFLPGLKLPRRRPSKGQTVRSDVFKCF